MSPATDGDGYIVSFCLYRDDLKILSINCKSAVEDPAPSDLVFSDLDMSTNGGVIHSKYMPELIVGGMDVRTTELEDYLRYTGQKDKEYIMTMVPFDRPDGTQTVFSLATSFFSDESGWFYGDPFIRGIRCGKDLDNSGKARMLKTEYTYPGKNAMLPPHTPFSEILAAENESPVSPDDMDDRQEYALALDGTLYDLMQMLDDIGIDLTFTASMDSDYCTVRTCNGERYVIMELKCPAIDDSYHLVEVYVKEGDPVINGTVTELSERIVELIVDEQTDTDE